MLSNVRNDQEFTEYNNTMKNEVLYQTPNFILCQSILADLSCAYLSFFGIEKSDYLKTTTFDPCPLSPGYSTKHVKKSDAGKLSETSLAKISHIADVIPCVQ